MVVRELENSIKFSTMQLELETKGWANAKNLFLVKLKQFKILAETIRRACRVIKGLVVSPSVQRAARGEVSCDWKKFVRI